MNKFYKIVSGLTLLVMLSLFMEKGYAQNSFQNKESSVSQDSLAQIKTKKVTALIKISSFNEEDGSHLINKNTLETIDYRTTADVFLNIPFGFLRDLGSVGQPNELLISGFGNGKISFLSDGIEINNRLSSSFDLNLFQSESIDSIEIISSSHGFIYNKDNNPVTVNFITRETNTLKPFSRIKYYQAPNSEGFIDGIFSLTPFKKLNTYFEITNQSTGKNYTNTDHSNWMGLVRIRYLLSERINFLAKYSYLKTETQLFGGIDADSIRRAYNQSQFEEILYDKFRAPVKFINRYQKLSGHNFNLHLLGEIIPQASTDLSFYYQTSIDEFRQNENSESLQKNRAQINDDNESKTFGFNLRQDFNFDFLKLTSITNFEKNTFNSPLLSEETVKTSFSTSAIVSSRLFDNKLHPSISAKYLNTVNNNYFSFAAEMIFRLKDFIKLSAGLSSYEKPYNIWEERFVLPTRKLDKQTFTNFDLSAEIQIQNLRIQFSYFKNSIKNALLSTLYTDITAREQTTFFDKKDLRLQGVNLNLDFNIWKILVATNSSYYFSLQDRKDYKLPQFTSYGGIYYIDTLFNSNLKLKTGVNYFVIGQRNFIGLDFEKNISSYYTINPFAQSDIVYPDINSSVQIDFFLAGRIQDTATVYFIYENILNTKYYIVPFYPKQLRGLRFGVAWEFLD